MQHYLYTFISMMLILALGGCNTMEGIGRDIGAAGDAIRETSRDTKDKM